MEIKEQISAKIEQMPEVYLPELLELIEKFENEKSKPGLLKRLQKIKIQGPSDFSSNIDLYGIPSGIFEKTIP